MFDALCASLIKKPDACFKEGIQKEGGFSGPAVFIIIMVVLSINIILFILCKNLIKKKIMDRIESIKQKCLYKYSYENNNNNINNNPYTKEIFWNYMKKL